MLRNRPLILALLIVLGGGAYYFYSQQQHPLPDDIAFGNGRIEAVQVDVSSLIPGRIETIEVKEGDLVETGQRVATIDAETIEAKLAQARAEISRAVSQIAAGRAAIAQAEAVLLLAQEEMERAEQLVERNAGTQQALDGRRTDVRVAEAVLAAAEAALVSYERGADAATAAAAEIESQLDDTELFAPTLGRVLYRLVEPGEVIGAGAHVLTLVDLTEVYLEFFLPASRAHRIAVGAEARIQIDIVDAVVPATVTYVSPVAQFTPRQVETAEERENLMFRVRARVPQDLVQQHIDLVRTGIRGIAYVRLEGPEQSPWPEFLTVSDIDLLRGQ